MIGPTCHSGHHMLHNDIIPQYTKAAVIRKYIKNSMYALRRSGDVSCFIRTTRVQLPNRRRLAIRISIAMISSVENKNMVLFIIACQSLHNMHGGDSSAGLCFNRLDVIKYLSLIVYVIAVEMVHNEFNIGH